MPISKASALTLATLGLMLVFMIALVWYRLAQVENYKATNEVKFRINDWRSPHVDNATAPDFETISRAQWSFDFTEAEAIITRFPVDDRNQLIIGHKTAKRLEYLLQEISAHTNKAVEDRVAVLITKTLPKPASDSLAMVFKNYCAYRRAIEQSNHNAPLSVAQKMEQQQQQEQLQVELFGPEIAALMFNKSNRLTNYLLSRIKNLSDKSAELQQQSENLPLNRVTQDQQSESNRDGFQ